MTDRSDQPRQTLRDTCDAIVIARRPVGDWARRPDCEGLEEARRILTAYAALSRAVDAEVEPEQWRYRRGRYVDITFRVVREEVVGARIAVVIAAAWERRR